MLFPKASLRLLSIRTLSNLPVISSINSLACKVGAATSSGKSNWFAKVFTRSSFATPSKKDVSEFKESITRLETSSDSVASVISSKDLCRLEATNSALEAA